MGIYPPPCVLTTLPGYFSIVSPYLANISVGLVGSVRMTGFTTDHPQMSEISDFIQYQTGGDSFIGTRMMVAEWDRVAEFDGNGVCSTHVLVKRSKLKLIYARR